ncbi:UbiA family prenyltransferase [Pontibacter vulgaris]|uniref:UbiA family prenyltransferase n=1 Tax=Pontibacter vulgaris TaxID=2905679 RepID=UPI001FA76E78|nr:UbiA family prenyltransferase [Pontibacter vulgaris]
MKAIHQTDTTATGLAKYKSALVLLRIPFSVYLMPIFWFALSTVSGYEVWRAVLVFIVLHLLVYPASNGYNSYHDRDEESIGGLKKPPKVTPELYQLVLLFDVLSVTIALLLSALFACMVAVYLLVSKAYSCKGIRLKKYPILSTIIVTVFQGAFTYMMVQVGAGFGLHDILQFPNLWFALVSTLFLCGSYPLTQIYQHHEDSRRGDKTLSLLLGVQGTFLFAALSLVIGTGLLLYLYFTSGQFINIIVFLLCTTPILYYFGNWMLRAHKNPKAVNYENTMRMNKTSSLCISLAFILIIIAELYIT